MPISRVVDEFDNLGWVATHWSSGSTHNLMEYALPYLVTNLRLWQSWGWDRCPVCAAHIQQDPTEGAELWWCGGCAWMAGRHPEMRRGVVGINTARGHSNWGSMRYRAIGDLPRSNRCVMEQQGPHTAMMMEAEWVNMIGDAWRALPRLARFTDAEGEDRTQLIAAMMLRSCALGATFGGSPWRDLDLAMRGRLAPNVGLYSNGGSSQLLLLTSGTWEWLPRQVGEPLLPPALEGYGVSAYRGLANMVERLQNLVADCRGGGLAHEFLTGPMRTALQSLLRKTRHWKIDPLPTPPSVVAARAKILGRLL